ncbi:hypothetical protein TVAG_432470 [Trichomonas vaginalis G3]|uniref:Uncharacterized protein n=1 Tax=Trichomonas vaginalis (strain ATCC PRA-98 / G3) TaxID=412133 RepID=A2DIN8_TRIV3|nr:hypothetical protein TVAGG3_0562770 [Trichomonas vaginalis G3]EAY19651.1 hypothetical protein TVAG_432470 [Trichomonas vaginalis G3]KAI5521329.1 hypothetical protein TVAGG3_0562770 [Trichomonas vaginalis G3]|eukprot:XP_001580637.1 hypothetical protein [Trichomonas vaginalis G3]
MANVRTGSLFSFPMQPLASGNYFTTSLDGNGGLDDFLFPKKIDGLLPNTTRYNVFDSDGQDEDEESIDSDEKVKKFEQQRENLFNKFKYTNKKIQTIQIQTSKNIIQGDPKVHMNSAYTDLVKQINELSSQPDTELNKSNFSFSSDSHMTTTSGNGNIRSKRKSKPIIIDKEVDLQINTSWIQAASIEADEEYLSWLKDLPDTSSQGKSGKSALKPSDSKDILLRLDPLEEARASAFEKQKSFVEPEETTPSILEEKPHTDEKISTPQKSPQRLPLQRIPTAAELNQDWGFEDKQICASIRKFMQGMQGGAGERKRNK